MTEEQNEFISQFSNYYLTLFRQLKKEISIVEWDEVCENKFLEIKNQTVLNSQIYLLKPETTFENNSCKLKFPEESEQLRSEINKKITQLFDDFKSTNFKIG